MATKEDYTLSAALPASKQRAVATLEDGTLVFGSNKGEIQGFRRSEEAKHGFEAVLASPYILSPSQIYTITALSSPYFPGMGLAVGTMDGSIFVCSSELEKLGESEHIEIKGHQQAVSSMAVLSDGTLVSSSWDGTAKFWRGQEQVAEIKGIGHVHSSYVAVTQDPSGTDIIGLGSSAKLLTLHTFNPTNCEVKLIKKIPNAHSGVIRKIRAHPLGFASCGNDGLVNLWSVDGAAVGTFIATQAMETIDSITYDMHVNVESGCMWVTSDDNYVRCFTLDGQHTLASLLMPSPGIGVTSIKRPNGKGVDVVIAAFAGAWVITGDKSLQAESSMVELFNAAAIQARDARTGVESIPVDGLPTVEVLLKAGSPQGEKPLIVNVGGRAMVFLWNHDAMEWQLQGEAIGKKKAPKKQMHTDGKEYDVIIQVDLSPGLPPIPLAFNKDEDPEDIATQFIATHGLSVDSKQEIIEFITPLVDMNSVSRKRAKAGESMRDGSRSSTNRDRGDLSFEPAWVVETAKLSSAIRDKAVLDAILRRSSDLSRPDGNQDHSLTDVERQTLEAVIQSSTTAARVEPTPLPQNAAALITKLLGWPTQSVTPCIDLIRALVANPIFITDLILPEDIRSSTEVTELLSPGRSPGSLTNAEVQRRGCTVAFASTLVRVCDSTLSHISTLTASSGQLTGQIVGPSVLAIQALANYVVKRPPLAQEERFRQSAPSSVVSYLSGLYQSTGRVAIAAGAYISTIGASNPAVLVIDAFATLTLNLVIWLGRLRDMSTSPLWATIGAGILALLTQPRIRGAISAQTTYYLYLSLLSIFVAAKPEAVMGLIEPTAQLAQLFGSEPGAIGDLARAFKAKMSQ